MAKPMTLRQARAAVAAMPELSQARTPRARENAAKRSRSGVVESKVIMSEPANADLAWLRQRLGLANRDVIERALANFRRETDLRQRLSDPGQEALEHLLRLSDAKLPDVIDFCIRFTRQELRSRKVVSVT